MTSESHEFEFDYQQPELTRAAWLLFGYGPGFLWSVGSGIVVCVAILFGMWRYWVPGTLYLVLFSVGAVLFGIAVIGSLTWFPWAFYQYRRGLLEKWSGRTVRVSMTPAEILLSSEHGLFGVGWARIRRVARSAQDVMLFVDARSGVLLPLARIPPAAAQFVEQQVASLRK